MIVNLQPYLVELFAAFLKSVKAEEGHETILDVFSGQSSAYRLAVIQWLAATEITTDLTIRQETASRTLSVIQSYPVLTIPFPQIGVYLAGEEMQDFPLGMEGFAEPEAVPDGLGVVTGWRIEHGAIATLNYRADIMCQTPEETVWLSRLLQRALYGAVMELETMGVMETRFGMADLRLDQEQLPAQAFARGINITGKALHRWHTTIPATPAYRAGNNAGLYGLRQ